jgi:hypothetical protein
MVIGGDIALGALLAANVLVVVVARNRLQQRMANGVSATSMTATPHPSKRH